MSVTSPKFILFILTVILIYYLAPKRFQWIVLLIGSSVFYYVAGLKAALYVLVTAVSIFTAARFMDYIIAKQKIYISSHLDLSKDEKKLLRKRNQKKRKAIMLSALLLNIGILCFTKYAHFAIDQINTVFSIFGDRSLNNNFNLIVPLGISFYTFQAVGYLLDVYWETIQAQKNIFRFLLFVSFFPQMTQGPISDYKTLSEELFSTHQFNYQNFAYGIQRIVWGFAKKLLVADIMGLYVSNLSQNYVTYTGITSMLGAFCYSIQIYADFSGYMDIMCGLCQILGIHLSENFNRPYFSKSIAEYWRRWHITLGEWFKKYIYYPIGMSNWSRNIAKKTKARLGTHFANNLPATIALLIVWTATGLWHGATRGYIVWGLLNGIFIIFSMWMEPVYAKIKSTLIIRNENRIFQSFQVIRTFFLVTLIKILPEVGSLQDGWGLWKHIFTDYHIPKNFSDLFAFIPSDLPLIFSITAFCGTAGMLSVSLLQRKCGVRERFNKNSYGVRIALLSVFTLFVLVMGGYVNYHYSGGGFLYAGF